MEKLLTPKEVSSKIGLGMNNTYKLFGLQGFPKIQIGKKFFVKECDLEEYLSEHKKSKIFIN